MPEFYNMAVWFRLALLGDMPPFYLHHVMFIPTLMSQCDESQAEKWLPLAYTHQIIGTYAQTELGHGEFKIASLMCHRLIHRYL